jgi:hypothetical protein
VTRSSTVREFRMPTPNKLLHLQIPPVTFRDDRRKTWCQRILDKALSAADERGVTYDKTDQLSLRVRVYLSGHELTHSDVDNLLTLVMNALQGQVGGQGKKIMHPERRVIRNDRQVWHAEIEKVERPIDMSGDVGGELTIECL